jgi:hypothetical protein
MKTKFINFLVSILYVPLLFIGQFIGNIFGTLLSLIILNFDLLWFSYFANLLSEILFMLIGGIIGGYICGYLVPCEKEQSIIRLMKILRKKGNSYKKISEVVTKSTRKKFAQSWVFNIIKREETIPPNEEIIRHNISNVELQPNICDI